MGTEAIRKADIIASVSLRPMKKSVRFRVTPVMAAQKKREKSTLVILRFLKMKSPRMSEAKAIRKKAKENIGISSKVSFMIGAVVPQIMAAVEV